MNLHRLIARGPKGLALFGDAGLDVDCDALPEGLIAVVGANGQGKTTFFEAVPAALYGEWPSRPGQAFVDAFEGRQAFLDVTLSDVGARYRARVNVDQVARATDAVLQIEDDDRGLRALNDGKVTTFRKAVCAHLPSLSVLLASAFACQKKTGSFARLDRAGRRALFAELLGLRHLEGYATTARAAAGVVEKRLTRLQALVDHLRPLTTDAEAETYYVDENRLQADLGDAQEARAVAQQAVAGLEATIADLRDRAAEWTRARGAAAAATAEAAGHQRDLDRIRRDRSALTAATARDTEAITARLRRDVATREERIANNRALLDHADEIRAAAAAADEADARLTRATQRVVAQRAVVDLRRREASHADRALRDAETADRDRARLEEATRLLGTVPCGAKGPYAACGFLQNALAMSAELGRMLPSATGAAQVRVGEEATLSAEADETLQAAIEHETRCRQNAQTGLTGRGHLVNLQAAEARVVELRADILRLETDAAEAVRRNVEADAAQMRQLDADERVAAEQLAEADRLTRSLQVVVDTTADAAAALTVAQQGLGAAQADRQRAGEAVASLRSEAGAFDQRRQAFVARRAQMAQTVAGVATLATDLVEWQALARIFGKEGLQTLEIDAAGPGVSSLANDLLATCSGGRFSIELVTQQATTDGKDTKEVFGVSVYDHARGGEAKDLGLLSGGEEVIVEEALRSAIALHLNARNEQPIRTCWRDETIGALDPTTAPQYVAMLRRLQARGGFRRVYFITHNLQAAALADAQLQFADGTVTTALPPFAEAM